MKTIQNRKIGNFPFCWQDKTILRFLANTYKEHPKKLRTARSIYLALTELASNQGEESTFNAYRNQIGQLSGSSASTVDRYVKDFISFLILSKENRKKDLINLSNSWNLLAPISPTGYSVPASGDTPKQDSSESSNQDSSEVIEEVNKEKNIQERKDSEALIKLREKVDRIRRNVYEAKKRNENGTKAEQNQDIETDRKQTKSIPI